MAKGSFYKKRVIKYPRGKTSTKNSPSMLTILVMFTYIEKVLLQFFHIKIHSSPLRLLSIPSINWENLTQWLINSLSFLCLILLHGKIVCCSHLDKPGRFYHWYVELAKIGENFFLLTVEEWRYSFTQLCQRFGSRCQIFEPVLYQMFLLCGNLFHTIKRCF